MTSFINKILDSLPDYQKSSIKSLLDKKTKIENITSLRLKSDEAQRLYTNLKGKLGGVLLSPLYQVEGDKISSEDINKNSEEIYSDLNSLYLYVDNLAKINNLNSITLDSEYLKARAAIEKLLNDVRTFSLRKQYSTFNEVKVIDFNINKNYTKTRPTAVINTKTRLLELPIIYSSKAHLQNRLNKFTSIFTKTYTSGIYGSINKSFGPEMTVDQKPETFWGHMVMSDLPIVQKYERASSGANYQEEVKGPVTEVFYNFSSIEKINVVRILPFSEYPITVLDISYRSSDSSAFFQTIDDFVKETTLDWIEYNFKPVYAKEIRITILQENYKKVNYTFPKKLVTNTDLFNRILEEKSNSINNSLVFDSDEYVNLLSLTTPYQTAIDSLNKLLEETDSIADSSINYLTKYSDSIDSVLNNVKQDSGEVINLSKYEYILGIREVELSYELYSPIANYRSEEYSLKATPSEISIESDYHAPENTSLEFEIDLGEGRRLPIHPRNITGDGGVYRVFNEKLEIDRNTKKAFTRLGSYYATPISIKRDGQFISPENYTGVRVVGTIPKLEFTFSGNVYDKSSIYTVDYAVSPVSVNLQILDTFYSRATPTPEVFSKVGENNDIRLSKFPFINYEIINSSSVFNKASGESYYRFNTPQADMYSGQVRLTPTIVNNAGDILQTGSLTGYSISGLWGDRSGEEPVNYGNVLSASYFNPVSGLTFGYYIGLMTDDNYTKLSSFNTGITGFVLNEPYTVSIDQVSSWAAQSSGISFVGDLTAYSGYLQVDYVIGVGVLTDNTVYTLGQTDYYPLNVKVGGRLARNITNYEKLIHPAFSIANTKDTEYEYIQAGNNIYFNQKIDKEILVDYRWVSEYVSVDCLLKCNKQLNPDSTPKIDEIRVLINNMVI